MALIAVASLMINGMRINSPTHDFITRVANRELFAIACIEVFWWMVEGNITVRERRHRVPREYFVWGTKNAHIVEIGPPHLCTLVDLDAGARDAWGGDQEAVAGDARIGSSIGESVVVSKVMSHFFGPFF